MKNGKFYSGNGNEPVLEYGNKQTLYILATIAANRDNSEIEFSSIKVKELNL